MVRINEYPQLNLITWNLHADEIEDEEALAIYEANWRYIAPEELNPRERALVDRLVREYGRGVLNV